MSQAKTVPRRNYPKRSNGCARIGILVVVALICVFSFAAAAWWGIPARAETLFGQPASWVTGSDLFLYSTQLLVNQNSLLQPLDSADVNQDFQIREGDSVNLIVNNLESAGLIQSAAALRSYIIYKGFDTRLQAGNYSLSASMTGVEIANRLLDATPEDVKFVILPGWRADEIAESLPTSGLQFTPNEFLRIVHNPSGVDQPLDLQLTDLEGYLMPGEYKIPRNTSAVQFVNLLLRKFDQSITPEIRKKINDQGLKLTQAVILASIVQREAVVGSEQPLIASVFLNRLSQGMKLESDPTVQYALGSLDHSAGWWKSPLSLDDLQVDSSYNTYQVAGLPPGPICNPSLSAIMAVAEPVHSDYFFFQAKCDGSGLHSFARTFEEHLQNSCHQ